jgi:AAA15 family ATPase/GTPase
MLTKLNIDDFKGIHSLQFESLARINLLAGANDVGKTSAMEALNFLFVNDQQSLSNFIGVPERFLTGWKGAESLDN